LMGLSSATRMRWGRAMQEAAAPSGTALGKDGARCARAKRAVKAKVLPAPGSLSSPISPPMS